MPRDGKREAEELELVSPLPLLLGSDSSRDDSALCLHCQGGEHCACPGDLHFVLCGFQTGGFIPFSCRAAVMPPQTTASAASNPLALLLLMGNGISHFQGDSQGVPLSSAGLCCTPGQEVPVLQLSPSCVCVDRQHQLQLLL